ncbi:MAG: sigma 54-interacting transcriptional regulator [Vicinamibacterales bacterium]
MNHLLPWLTDHVRGAAEKCGALGASVYVPTPWNPSEPGILVHVGDAAPLPEMSSLEGAAGFAQEAAAGLGPPDGQGGAAAAVLPSAVPEGCYLPIPLLATLWHRGTMAAGPEPGAGRSRRLADRLGGPPIVGWLGLRFAEAPKPVENARGWHSLLELASALASTYVCFYGILTDPVTGLPGRAELNGMLRAELDRAHANRLPFSLLFVKLEQLDDVNERLGRRMGDAALREFLDELHDTLRRSDTVMRYGASVFALPLRDVTSSGAMVVGEKIQRRMGRRVFLDGAVHLPCAVGIASCDGLDDPPLQPLDLLRRADQALSASQRGGASQVVLWRADGEVATTAHLDPLLGVFTGQTEQDYRNMRLLWDVLQAVSRATGAELAEAVVARLFALFRATRVALLEPAADRGLTLTVGQQRLADSGDVRPMSGADLTAHELRLIEAAVDGLASRRERIEADAAAGTSATLAVAVPLLIDGRALGALYLRGGAETLRIDDTDLPVLSSVAAQLALALDRAALAEQQRAREHRERQLLKAEVDRLRTVLKHSQFLFRSKPMAALLDTTRRVAGTDATVLITGESGTGKEMLAHTLHELSGRRGRPLVIVDCGAIPASLIDSELFGHERGAYTGAERRTGGRLAQADGGTVFLDEIGELPLEVQAKLLRFVQEKTITMVGGTRPQKVDVRIVAATNRPLEHEVRAGRFREDLFHRLNVVRLRVPSLRERPDDVVFLARHFLETFSQQYAKAVRSLDPAAERRLESHDWPGNVRELQNTVLQAVVLAEGDVVRAEDLQLPDGSLQAFDAPGSAMPVPVTSPTSGTPATSGASGAYQSGAPGLPDRHGAPMTPVAPVMPRAPVVPAGTPERTGMAIPGFDDAWRALADRLAAEITQAVGAGARLGPPLGKWLARDLVLEAHEQAGGVAARAAVAIGVPETTYSRRLRQAEASAASTRATASWSAVRSALGDVLRAGGRPDGNLLDQLEDLLLGLVVAQVPDSIARIAGLMGVSVPTIKRRLGGRPAGASRPGGPLVTA